MIGRMRCDLGTGIGLRSVRTQTDGKRCYAARFARAGRVRAAGNEPGDIDLLASALQAAVESQLFEGRAVFVDHVGLFENASLRNLVGVTREATWNATAQAVEGVIELYGVVKDVGDLLDEILAQGESAPDVGLSMVFYPRWGIHEHGVRQVVEIKHIESLDLVFQPAADGRLLRALSGERRLQDCEGAHDWHACADEMICLNCGMVQTKTLEEGMNEEQTKFEGGQAVREADTKDRTEVGAGAAPHGAAGAEAWLPAVARAATQAMLASSGLPAASRERLATLGLTGPDQVEMAIAAERDYLAKLGQANVVQIGGQAPRGGHVQVGMDGLERLQVALEALMQGRMPEGGVHPLSGIREAYVLLSGDYEMTGLYRPERVQFANVNASTMAGMVANALNKSVVKGFQEYPRWWEPIVFQEDFSSLQQVKWITLGGVGDLPTVAEGAAYTELTWDDQTETASFVKKGGYLGITLEAIDKDDTRRLAAAPRALAQAAWLSLSKSVSAIFTDNTGTGPTMSDSTALFTSGHGNLGSTALSITSWAATRLAMRKHAELNSTERLGALTAPKYLLVPPDLEITAMQVLGTEKDYTYALSNGVAAPDNVFAEGNLAIARLRSARERVVTVDLWTDTNNWAAVADPLLYPTIGLGFRYGRTPEIFSVASPTAGLMFTNDTMPIKARFFYAVGPTDWRGLYKHNVA